MKEIAIAFAELTARESSRPMESTQFFLFYSFYFFLLPFRQFKFKLRKLCNNEKKPQFLLKFKSICFMFLCRPVLSCPPTIPLAELIATAI